MKDIPDGSIDLVLTDPPYGVITKSTHDLKGWQNKSIKWDKTLDVNAICLEMSRILRPNGKAVLFSCEPYTSELVTRSLPSLPFSYRAAWIKNNAGNVLGSKSNMVSYLEDICIFSKPCPKYDYENTNPLRDWFKEQFRLSGIGSKECRKLLGNEMFSHYCTEGFQFAVPTELNYKKLQATGFFNRDYSEIKAIHSKWQDDCIKRLNALYPSVFNLWQGGKSKSNVLEYAKDGGGYHPTQKPILLLEDLIKTFSNEGDLVVDLTMGSGSTGVACINTGRNFIGIELDETYFNIAQERINLAQAEHGAL